MARGNCTVVSANPRVDGFTEGYVKSGETHYPGLVVQRDTSVALKGGRPTFKLYARDADGDHPVGPFYVVTEKLQASVGKTMSDSIAAGDREMVYAPLPGDELNLVISNVSGTATVAAGTLLIPDSGTGELVVTTGSPETEVALLLEDVVDNAADQLGWCQWTGH